MLAFNVKFVVVDTSQTTPVLDNVQVPDPIVIVLTFELVLLNAPVEQLNPLALNVPVVSVVFLALSTVKLSSNWTVLLYPSPIKTSIGIVLPAEVIDWVLLYPLNLIFLLK